MSLLRPVGISLLVILVIGTLFSLILFSFDLRKSLAPRLERVATAALDRRVSVGGAVRLGLWHGGPKIVLEDVRLANAAWGTKPEMLKIGRLELRARLRPLFSDRIAIRELVLDRVEALIETRDDGVSNRPRPGALGGKVGLFGRIKISGPEILSARQVSFDFRSRPGMPRLGARFERINIRPAGKDSFKFSLLGTVHDKLLGIEATLNEALALIQGRQSPLQGAVSIGNSTVLVTGRVGGLARGPGFVLRLEGSAPDLRDFGALLGISGLPEGFPVVFSATLNGVRGRASLSEFSARVGTGTIVGTLDMTERNGAPSFDGVFASEVLDLAPFLGRWWSADDFAAFAAKPFAVDFFRRAHIDVSYQAQLLRLGRASLEAADIRLLLAGGVLTLYPLSIYNDGSPFEGELSIDFNSGGEGEFRAVTRRFPLGPLLEGAGHGDALSGDLALSVELTGQGPSLEAMLSDLKGQLSLAVTNGMLGPAALDYLPEAWRPVYREIGEGEAAVPLACLRGRMMFDGDQGEARTLLIDTGASTTMGAARLDLESGELAAILLPRAKGKSQAGVAVELALEGPLAAPQGFVVGEGAGPGDKSLSEGLRKLASSKGLAALDEPCQATFEGGMVPRVNDPTVISDPTQAYYTDGQSAEGSEP